MAGSVSGFSCSPAALPATSCCISICAMLRMSSSSKQSAFLVSTSSIPHSMKWEPRNHFWKGSQDVVAERIEIDYVDLRGPAFEGWDHRALQVHLVRAGLAEAVFFPSKGSTVPPTEVLYKRAVVLAPGFFSHTDAAHSQVHLQLLASALQEL